jgi:hypothetical protein
MRKTRGAWSENKKNDYKFTFTRPMPFPVLARRRGFTMKHKEFAA